MAMHIDYIIYRTILIQDLRSLTWLSKRSYSINKKDVDIIDSSNNFLLTLSNSTIWMSERHPLT